MRPRRPTRLPGFPYVGIYRYSLRFGTNGRQSWFLDAHYVAIAVTQILRTAVAESFLVLAYCFMPDHVHLLVEGTQESSDLRRFARIAKQRTGYAFSTRLGIPAFWQDGYYERVLRSEEATETVVRYIFDNPVRAGLVQRAEGYPFSGGLFWPAMFAQSAKPSASHGQSWSFAPQACILILQFVQAPCVRSWGKALALPGERETLAGGLISALRAILPLQLFAQSSL